MTSRGPPDCSDRTSRWSPARAHRPGLRLARTRGVGDPDRIRAGRVAVEQQLVGFAARIALFVRSHRGKRPMRTGWRSLPGRRRQAARAGARRWPPGPPPRVMAATWNPGTCMPSSSTQMATEPTTTATRTHDEADQPTRLVSVSDGAADQDHNGEADRGPSHMREHKLLLRVRPGFRLLSERPNRTREGKRPSMVSDVPRPVLRGRGPLVSHP